MNEHVLSSGLSLLFYTARRLTQILNLVISVYLSSSVNYKIFQVFHFSLFADPGLKTYAPSPVRLLELFFALTEFRTFASPPCRLLEFLSAPSLPSASLRLCVLPAVTGLRTSASSLCRLSESLPATSPLRLPHHLYFNHVNHIRNSRFGQGKTGQQDNFFTFPGYF